MGRYLAVNFQINTYGFTESVPRKAGKCSGGSTLTVGYGYANMRVRPGSTSTGWGEARRADFPFTRFGVSFPLSLEEENIFDGGRAYGTGYTTLQYGTGWTGVGAGSGSSIVVCMYVRGWISPTNPDQTRTRTRIKI